MAKGLLRNVAGEVLMLSRGLAAFLVSVGFVVVPASAQTAPNPVQQSVTTNAQGGVVFRVTVVGRTIPTVNYRPRSGDTELDMVGTALMPRARGEIEVSGKKGYIEISGKFDRLEPPTRFGPEYLTYVMWAITPEGRATNLGELQIKDERRVRVTTELQAFGLIVTAEPYFAVTQPSDVVVMENAVKRGTEGRIETIDAKYELLKRGSYLMNQAYANLKVKTPEPGTQLDLAQARNAVALALVAGANEFAAETFAKADALLQEAEQARERRRGGNAVQQPARQAAQTAEDARIIALQRQEEQFEARERALAAQREAEARARAQAEEEARQRAEIERALATQREGEARARARAEEEARQKAEIERAQADAARLAAERQRLDAEAAKIAADRARADAERARLDAERERQAAEAARAAAETQAQAAREAVLAAERDKAELRAQLREQLNVILETRETARGLIVNLSDVLFDFNKATLRPGAREKLAKIAGIILAHPGLRMEAEGHADAVGTDDYNLRLSERRAQSVSSFLLEQGIRRDSITAMGFGESRPVATNGTAEGRQQNRRVELVVSGEPIGTSGTGVTTGDAVGTVGVGR
jgi:outer membrane protein OmpA-like peptidoglycan-associated protein